MFCLECSGLQKPSVVWYTRYHVQFPVENIFDTNGLNWVAPDNYKGHGFTLKLSDCKLNIAGIRLKNSCCRRGTRAFHISGLLEDGGPWVQLLEGELVNAVAPAPNPKLQTFHFKEAVETQFLKFDVDSYWGPSGGLNFLQVITVTGDFIFSFRFYCAHIFNRGVQRKHLQALLLWIPNLKGIQTCRCRLCLPVHR